MLFETEQLARDFAADARDLDRHLIQGRDAVVSRNLSKLEGIQRSRKYAGRLAGKSSDTRRKARTEQYVEWFAAIAIEDVERSARVQALFSPLFSYAAGRVPWSPLEFWKAEEDACALMSRIRTAYLDANGTDTRFVLVLLKQKVEEMLRMADAMPNWSEKT